MSSTPPNGAGALRSVHTSNLPELFEQFGISLVVSTYQAGKVIIVRNDQGTLNTHFRTFAKPMGITADEQRLIVGGSNTVWYYRNMPAVAQKLEPPDKHDACYLPRRIHVTGDIDIHELAWDRDGTLWVVNTRFGCLCTLDAEHSFYPRWRPPFLSALAPEDRCHLNGLALVDGRPKYVTALGETDTAGGWRANKANGGILMDIDRNEIMLRGLSMPHSPRWYQDTLWLLESGEGTLARVDLPSRRREMVAQVPGFTRGIDFVGPLAFIGLSQVRERAVFSGIPLVERLSERTCGVWVVHIESGETIGFLRFEEGVQEIFAVQVLRGIRFPEVLEWDDPLLMHSYVLPDEALAEVTLPSEEQLAKLPGYHFERATECYRQGKLTEAVSGYRRCLALQSDYPNANYNLGIALGDMEHYDEAVTVLQQVTEAEPERAEAHNSLGHVYSAQRRVRQAIKHYHRAIELQPDYSHAHFNLGMTLLQTGDFARGFAECEWRWKTQKFTILEYPQPRWDGRRVPEHTLLIHAEQSAGDAIQFARYLPFVAERCKKLMLVCTPDIKPLLATLPGIDDLCEPGQIDAKAFDFYLPLQSLPYVFETTPATVPASVPYLAVDPSRRQRLASVIADAQADRLTVGIAWSGNSSDNNDKHRSCALAAFAPVLRTPAISFYSLQQGPACEQIGQLPPEFELTDLAPHLDDYADTAALIEALDLVICVDTPVVHLAGALGRPVWTLLAYNPDWRWMLERGDTPWYPTMRLFRQVRRGDWTGVMQHVAKALLAYSRTAR